MQDYEVREIRFVISNSNVPCEEIPEFIEKAQWYREMHEIRCIFDEEQAYSIEKLLVLLAALQLKMVSFTALIADKRLEFEWLAANSSIMANEATIMAALQRGVNNIISKVAAAQNTVENVAMSNTHSLKAKKKAVREGLESVDASMLAFQNFLERLKKLQIAQRPQTSQSS